MKEITKHLAHYLSLIGIIGVALVGLLIFHYDRTFQSIIAIAAATGYFFWGLAHHHLHEDLNHKIFLEYLAPAVFGAVILLAVIWSA